MGHWQLLKTILRTGRSDPRYLLPFLRWSFLRNVFYSGRVSKQFAEYQRNLESSSNPDDRVELEVVRRLAGSPGMAGGYDYLDFRRLYYEGLLPETQEQVRNVLLRLIGHEFDWLTSIQEKAVSVCIDLELEEALPKIKRLATDPKLQEHERDSVLSALKFFSLKLPGGQRSFFREYTRTIDEATYRRFIQEYADLPDTKRSR